MPNIIRSQPYRNGCCVVTRPMPRSAYSIPAAGLDAKKSKAASEGINVRPQGLQDILSKRLCIPLE